MLSLGSDSSVGTSDNSSTAISFGGSVVRDGLTLRRSLTVTFVYAAGSKCRSYGDPHITTFDRLGYGFQVPGLCRTAIIVVLGHFRLYMHDSMHLLPVPILGETCLLML